MNYRIYFTFPAGDRATNAQVFATREEALNSAADRFAVWTPPTGYEVEETEDPVTYHCNRDEAHIPSITVFNPMLLWGRSYRTGGGMIDTAKEKLWVFDTPQYLEIYAPTLEDARREVYEIEKQTGLDFDLAPQWEIYQAEKEEDA